ARIIKRILEYTLNTTLNNNNTAIAKVINRMTECFPGCNVCDEYDNCIECSNVYVEDIRKICYESCPELTFESSTKKCLLKPISNNTFIDEYENKRLCNSNCLGCYGYGPTNCFSCKNTTIWNKHGKLECNLKCPDNYQSDEGICFNKGLVLGTFWNA